jgi:dihydrofolate reductase
LWQRFLELGLVDEINLTIATVLLGEGLRLFGGSPAEQRWKLKNVVVAYKSGFVQLSYCAPTDRSAIPRNRWFNGLGGDGLSRISLS